MKTNLKYKILSVFLMAGIITGYTHCDMPGMTQTAKSTLSFGHVEAPTSASTSNSNTANAISAFSKTIWKVTNKRCASCHAAIQQPLHASNNIQTAYQATINGQKINISSADKSRLYLKLKDSRHNCWSNCDDNAQEMLEAIEDYIALANPSDDTGTTSNMTEEIGPFSSLSSVNDFSLFLADAFMLQTPFVIKTDNGMNYFTTSANTGINYSNADSRAGRAFLTFNISNSGTYNLWAYVKGASGGDDSFHVKVNNSKYYEWHFGQTSGYEWKKLTDTTAMNAVTLSLSNSIEHVLEVRQREDGAELAKVILTDDLEFTPAGTIQTSFALEYDISSLVNANAGSVIFKADIKEFDQFTYQITNLRVKSTLAVRIVAPKIFVNGTHSDQHNTFDYLDVTVPAGESSLAEYSMLVLKEDGNDSDLFSWSFDLVERQ